MEHNALKKIIKSAFRRAGYEICRTGLLPDSCQYALNVKPCFVEPVWPLPRRGLILSNEDIRRLFYAHKFWHYAYSFEGNLKFRARHCRPSESADNPERPLRRFRHFMPYLVAANGGSLRGKRVLDIACNSGFWSIQCALLGADVVGFDARKELIEQANLLKSIVGINNAEFRVMNFEDMNPISLDGRYDIVLNLGVLYHLPSPIEAINETLSMSRHYVLLDTAVARSELPIVSYRWEEPDDIRNTINAGIVAYPSSAAINLILSHLGVPRYLQIPVRTREPSCVYRQGFQASWLIDVST